MDFARPVAFKNADIGRCAYQKPREDEDAVPAEVVVQPQPVPTPAYPSPAPTLVHVSVHVHTAFEPSILSHFQIKRCSRNQVDSVTSSRAPGACV